jgi:hypothetical protein
MYGESCLGVDCDNGTEQLLIDIVKNWPEIEHHEYVEGHTLQELFQELESYSTDSMGRGMIIYWPDIPYEQDEECENEEE